MTECYRGINPQGSVRSLERTDVYCSKIYRRPACASAWHNLSIADTTPRTEAEHYESKPYWMAVIERCRADYCTSTDQAALCSPQTAITQANLRAFIAWLLLQELTFPDEQAAQWARAPHFGSWLP